MSENLNLHTIDTVDVSPFKKLVMTIGELPTSFVESMTYYEALAWFVKYLQSEVIPTVNNNAEAVEELQGLFTTLYNYVHDYFKNLDVQEEINNKLDEMAEDGTLADIIAAYIQLRGILAYDNVNDLKNATNISNGSFAETYGFYTKGDGGSAKYKIRNVTNDDVIDEMTILSITSDPTNTLIAELIETPILNVKQLGIKGDGTTDETTIINTAIGLGKPLFFPKGTYLLSSTLTLSGVKDIEGEEGTIINSYATGANVVFPIIDFSGCTTLTVKNLNTTNSSFTVYPTVGEGQTFKELMKDKKINIVNLTCDTNDINVTGKTNWQGLFINTPAPDNYTRDFHDGKYPRYGIDIQSNSGYNAINIDNIIKDNGSYATIPDNSAIGIKDGVQSAAPTVFLDLHSERCALGIKNSTSTSSASSTARDGRTFEVDYKGHVAIGCSTYSETGATGTASIKIKDSSPSIAFYDTNYASNLCRIREQDNELQFIANGAIRSAYNSTGDHVYSYPIRLKPIADSHGSLVFESTYNNYDWHMFVDSNGIVKIEPTAKNTVKTTETGRAILNCQSGATANRPTSRMTNDYQTIGYQYFDTTLGKPIWWTGSGWVDATGASV